MEYKYFTSYFYTNTEMDNGFGYTAVETNSEIKGINRIKELANHIRDSYEYKNVIILNFQEL